MTTPVPIESSAITGFMASAQRLFNRRGSSDSTSSEDGVKGNVNFNINAPEFIPKWKLPTSVNPDTDLTGFSPKEEKHLETEKEPDLEKSIKKKVKKKSNCEYCKKKGQRISIYTSHQMQDSNTEEILCPMLKKTLCPHCTDMRGINVHDFEECPRRGFRTLTAKPNIVISDPSWL